MAAPSKQSSEQSQGPDTSSKHRGGNHNKENAILGGPGHQLSAFGLDRAGLLKLLFGCGGLHVLEGLGGWHSSACPTQERGQEMLMDAQELLVWMSGVSLGSCKTILSKEVCAFQLGVTGWTEELLC